MYTITGHSLYGDFNETNCTRKGEINLDWDYPLKHILYLPEKINWRLQHSNQYLLIISN